jgi:deoxyribonuclease V
MWSTKEPVPLFTADIRNQSAAADTQRHQAPRSDALSKQAVRALPIALEVLLVNATRRGHPRRAGLALQLGAVHGLPTVGVTTRPLVAEGAWPADQRGATAPLRLGGEMVGC